MRDFAPGDANPMIEAALGLHAAHQAIEADLGRSLSGTEVWFTDDRADNVDAARQFGWDAVLFTPRTR